MWRKHCNHLCFQVIKCTRKLHFLFLSGTDGPAAINILAQLQGKSNIFCYKMQYNVLSHTVVVQDALLRNVAANVSGGRGGQAARKSGWARGWHAVAMVEEVVLVSTWVGPAPICPVSLSQVTCGVRTCVGWWLCGFISAPGFPAAWTQR